MVVVQGNRTLFAKNSDRPVSERQLVEAHPRRAGGGSLSTTYLTLDDPGAHALVGARPAWMWGLEHGVNEHGVAIGNEEIWTVDDPSALPPALTGMDLVRLGLERAAHAEEALEVICDLIETHGQGGIANQVDHEAYFSSFLIADPAGAWILETSARTWVAQPVHAGAAISNRVGVSTGWTRASPDVKPGADFDRWRHPDMWTGHAEVRLAASRATVGAAPGTVTPGLLAATLRDHGTGPWGAPGTDPAIAPVPPAGPGFDPATGEGITLCMHLRGYQATTASMVAELRREGVAPTRAWMGLGNPCASVLVPVLLPDGVPGVLADPDVADRFAALSRAVEAPAPVGGEVLATIRAELAPLEADLWRLADSVDPSDPDGGPALARATDTEVRAVLDRLAGIG